MGVLAWIVAPAIADGGGAESLFRPLLACLTVGLIWQFVLVVGLVGYEQRSLRWSRVREALWLRSAAEPEDRPGRRPDLVRRRSRCILGIARIEEMLVIPAPAQPRPRRVPVVRRRRGHVPTARGACSPSSSPCCVFNTVLGEELLFRGVLLPRMHGAFGDRDWVANGVLFAAYHLHKPWVIPATLLDMFLIAYPAKRYRSAWIGIVVHSAQTVLIAAARAHARRLGRRHLAVSPCFGDDEADTLSLIRAVFARLVPSRPEPDPSDAVG